VLSGWQGWSAAIVATLLTAVLVILEITDEAMRRWWSGHALTTDTVSGLLVLLITLLVIDQLVRLRQIQGRARAVGAQAAIILTQAVRASRSVSEAIAKGADHSKRDDAVDEFRTYMMMLLVGAPVLIDEKMSRTFLEQAQVVAAQMARALGVSPRSSADVHLDEAVRGLRDASKPLLQALDPQTQAAVSGDESALAVRSRSRYAKVPTGPESGRLGCRPSWGAMGGWGWSGLEGLGDSEEVVRLQEGIREWLLRSARNGRHELRGIPAPAVPPLLCAAAFGPVLADAAGLDSAVAVAVAGVGVLSSVGAGALGDVLAGALDRARSAHPAGDMSRGDVRREISRSIKEILSGDDSRAHEVLSDVAMVLREIDAGGTVFRAAIETGDEDLQREALAAVEAVSAEFGELEFILADLARAAWEIQASLGGQGGELRAASEQVARQSADVRVIREELAVIERRTRQWIPGSGGHEPDGLRWTAGCPYRGLLPYDQAHEAVFFGRDRLTATLVGTLTQSGLVMVTGASGAGKTSLLRAGLVPALARGVQVPGSSSWLQVQMVPGPHPLTELSARLAQLSDGDPAVIRKGLADAPGDAHLLVSDIVWAAADRQRGTDAARLVLIIDQFEQVFAATGEEGRLERAAFLEAVCAAATLPAGGRGEPPALAVIAVRGDYWDRCAAYPELVPAMERGQVVVGPMAEADLRRVITGPAEASGLGLEPGLADAILADLRSAGDCVGVLPLLSQALALTWEKREGDQLTRLGYQGTGDAAGIAGAVEVSAEAAYRGLAGNQQAIARDVFRRMTAMGPDHRPARRAVTSGDLHAGRPKSQWPEVDAVVEAFAQVRLLVLDAGRAEIAHDVLLDAWPRLRGWLDEDETSMILYGQLAGDTARWQASGHDRTLLYRGVQLAATREATRLWAGDPHRYPALSASEAEFLRASDRATARSRWRLRALAGLVAVLVVAALAGAGIAVKDARTSAARQSTANMSQRLAAQSTALDAADPVTAALLAAAAWQLDPTAQARYSLLQSLAQPVRGILAAQSGVVTALAYSPDGTTLAAGYSGGAIRLWDLASHRTISAATFGAAPLALTFTGDGKLLEAAGADAVGTWDLANQARITTRPLASSANGGAVALSPDGKTVATGGADGIIRLWDAATGQEIGSPMSSDASPVDAVAFSPDGTLMATASTDGNVQLWATATQQEAGPALIPNGPEVGALAFSPDGKLLATGSQDGTAQLWNVPSGSQAGTTMATGDTVSALTFGADGTTLATAEGDGATELWDVATQAQTGSALTTQGAAGVSSLAFSPDADALATGNGDGSIQLWNPAGFHQASAPLSAGPISPAPAAAGHPPATFSAGGGVLAASDGHGIVRVWDVGARGLTGRALSGNGTVTGLALSPDGKTLAIAGRDVQLWQTATGQRTGTALPAAGGGRYRAVAFSPDGTILATLGADGTARLWDVATQRQIGAPMTVDRAGVSGGAVGFSPDGKTLVTVGAGGQTRLWSAATQRPLGKPMAGDATTTVLAFSPSGTTLATAGGDGSVRLWDVSTQQEIGAPMTADAQPVYAAVFGPDGTTLATAGGDGSVRLWDVSTQQEIGAPMTADAQPVYAAAFGPDGTTLATAGGDGTVRTWDVAFPASLSQGACAIADVSLTRQQWADYAGSQPFQQVCPAS
jgi:WD40 repeat protein